MTDVQLRGAIVLGDVVGVDDAGEAQTVTVQTHDGVIRADVEVLQAAGFASHPGDGGLVLLLAVGGDQGHMVALPVGVPSRRYGAQPPGGAAIYDEAGGRLAFPADGTCVLAVAGLARVVAGTVRIEAQGGSEVHGPTVFKGDVRIEGELVVTGDVTVTGSISAGGNVHADGQVSNGSRVLTT